MRPILALFIVMPIIEMIVLIKVGSVFGALPTIGLVLLTAMIGVALLRQQGLNTLFRAQEKMRSGQLPVHEMVEGICLAVGGALLLTPGFVTDAIGFACLVPGLRQLLIAAGLRVFKPRVFETSATTFSSSGFSPSGVHNADPVHRDHGSNVKSHETIEGKFEREP